MNKIILTWLFIFGVLVSPVHPRRRREDICKKKCPLFDPVGSAILLPGPTKEHFYKCNYGVGILFRCYPGTHFNPKKKVCDWPWRARAVVCRGKPDYEGEGSGDDAEFIRID